MIWYVCQGKLAGHPYKKNNDFRPSKDFWRREDILFSSRILHTDKNTSNNENYRLQYIQKSDPENHLKISISSKTPSLSPERADINLNDSANSFSQRMNTIHQLCLIEKEEKNKQKAQKRGKALKIQMQKNRMRQRKRERDCNSRPIHAYHAILSTMWVCVSVFFYLQPLQITEVTKYSCFQRCNSVLSQKTAKKQERNRMRQREREGHINGGLMFKWILLNVSLQRPFAVWPSLLFLLPPLSLSFFSVSSP